MDIRTSSQLNSRRDVFSMSSREENDEEALIWAALQKLPIVQRMRTGILRGEDGCKMEIDVKNLNFFQKKELLDRLVQSAHEGHGLLMSKLKQRIDRVGICLPTIEVRFEHLNVDAEAYVGNRAMPTVTNFFMNIIEGSLNYLRIFPSRKRSFTILHDISGIVKPGRMTLLLGPPSSGKTTLLLALAGKLDKELKVAGKVTYNGHEMNEFIPQRTSAYTSQHDLHLRELTVRETIAFSARCQGVGPRYDMLIELSKREKEANIIPDPDLDVFMKAASLEGQEANVVTDYVIKTLGLDICADTLVGDEMIRGISGGQKKRLTIGEMLVGPARALFMDEISTGLDSSTAFQIVDSIKQTVHSFDGTAVVSLLQPAPETYNLFDDIILLSDGQIVYQGPCENVLEFFEKMGFKCPERKGVADFLQEVTSMKDQEQYWARKDEPYSFITVGQFAEAFKSFHIGGTLEEELLVPFVKSKSHPAALTTEKYGINKKELLKALTSRELLLMKRNSFVYIFTLSQLTVLSILIMTVFLRTKMHKETIEDGLTYMGAIFFIVMAFMFNSLAELGFTITRLPVFFKQRDLLFFPPWSYAIPAWIIKLPIAIIEVTILMFITYYGIGFDPNFGRLVKMIVILLGTSQMATGVYRLTGAIARNIIVANTLGIFIILIFLVLGGFVLSKDDIAGWLRWGYWISPLMYSQNALTVNEFLGHSWNKVASGSIEPLGKVVLRARGLFTEAKWYWIGVGALLIYTFVSNVLFSIALTYLNSKGKPQANLSEDNVVKENASTELPVRGNSSSEREVNIPRSILSTSSRAGSSTQVDQNCRHGMALPFEPLSITFSEIKYSVDMPQAMRLQGITEERLLLLKGISGSFRPGVLTALMGVTGAGKTTLMDVLAGRKTSGYIEGVISISGYPKKQETFARVSGYCEQMDIHSPNVTVYESLQFSAWLRLSPDLDEATKKMFVDAVMELVELTPLREALVGLPGVNGLSTEQRKRLTIAVELVANPSIIFMDEPTSGLDARAAAIVMRTVRNTVNTGRTVVCTIHQPSIDIFDAFDELFLLKQGGEEIYVGPIGRHSCHLIGYFESINGVNKIEDGYNPATWMLEVTSQAQEASLGIDYAQLYKNSELYRRNNELIKELSNPVLGSKDLCFPTQYSQPFFTQCIACLWRQHLSYWRNPSYSAVRLSFTTIIALLLGTIFWNLGSKRGKSQDIFNAMGNMFTTIVLLGTQNAFSVQPVVDTGRTVFYRERAAGMYSAVPYALGQVLIELPYVLVQTTLYSLLVYTMMGYEWAAAKFFWYFLFLYFTFLYFTFFGMMTVAITPNQHTAAVISTGFYSIWTLFSGFIIPKPRIPLWWRWMYNACPYAWTMSGLLTSQYGDFQNKIETGETVQQFIKRYFDFSHDFVGYNALIVVGLALIFGFTFTYSIKSFNFQNR